MNAVNANNLFRCFYSRWGPMKRLNDETRLLRSFYLGITTEIFYQLTWIESFLVWNTSFNNFIIFLFVQVYLCVVHLTFQPVARLQLRPPCSSSQAGPSPARPSLVFLSSPPVQHASWLAPAGSPPGWTSLHPGKAPGPCRGRHRLLLVSKPKSFLPTVSISWQEEGYTVKYNLQTRDILRAQSEGFSKGSGYISPYISTQVIIQTF